MPVIPSLARRGDTTTLSPTTVNLLIALVVLFATIALLTGTLLILRQMRLRRQEEEESAGGEASTPMFSEKANASRISICSASPSRSSRLIVETPRWNEKETLIRSASTGSSPTSPGVPEIRITFPEEVDESGRRTSGRIVVVKVGEHSIGMEPVTETVPPPYQEKGYVRFESLDLDRIGGLKEKEMR